MESEQRLMQKWLWAWLPAMTLAVAVLSPASAAPDLPTWGLGPFVKADAVNPALSPQPQTFSDPMTGKPVAWEQDNRLRLMFDDAT
jgi:hypothetical protein